MILLLTSYNHILLSNDVSRPHSKGLGRTGQDRTGQDRTGQDRKGQLDKAHQVKARQSGSGHSKLHCEVITGTAESVTLSTIRRIACVLR